VTTSREAFFAKM